MPEVTQQLPLIVRTLLQREREGRHSKAEIFTKIYRKSSPDPDPQRTRGNTQRWMR